jgi:hypothetical protein
MPWRILGAARSVGGSGYNIAMGESRRDEFPNSFVGEFVPTDH